MEELSTTASATCERGLQTVLHQTAHTVYSTGCSAHTSYHVQRLLTARIVLLAGAATLLDRGDICRKQNRERLECRYLPYEPIEKASVDKCDGKNAAVKPGLLLMCNPLNHKKHHKPVDITHCPVSGIPVICCRWWMSNLGLWCSGQRAPSAEHDASRAVFW